MSITNQQYQKGLNRMADEIAFLSLGAPVVQAQELQGLILSRVFGGGIDSQGKEIGQYKGAESPSKGRYKALRNSKGLRIDRVDLQFSGALFESIKTGKEGEFALVGFDNSNLSKIGRYNEERYGKDIFKPTTEEQEDSKRLMVDYIKKQLQIKIKTILGGR